VTKRAPRTYPWTTSAGDLEVTFRLMCAADRDRVTAFTQGLPEQSLLFLRSDITQPAVIDRWVRQIENGRTMTVLAEESERMIGYCSLHRSDILWSRHVGEIRLLVAPDYRGQGVGGLLVRQIFRLAQDTDLLKLVANMMSTQRDAQSLFHHLGFIPEAMLHDWAIDRKGRTHDLIIMSREVEDEESP
jgi:RimJ/RimL family protein N-acetyltransferase